VSEGFGEGERVAFSKVTAGTPGPVEPPARTKVSTGVAPVLAVSFAEHMLTANATLRPQGREPLFTRALSLNENHVSLLP